MSVARARRPGFRMSVLGIFTVKRFHKYEGRYYTYGGFGGYLEETRKHFDKTIMIAHVRAATLLAVSNIRGHRHWVSDMVAGTALGIGIGEVVLRNSDAYRSGGLTAAPMVTEGGTGLSLGMRF